ncbi:MAG: hypothetical protein VCD00_15325 [Candidatus Hydrogenedentota bacterium]
MIELRLASEEDVGLVSAILVEAARWMESIGQSLWALEKLSEQNLRGDIKAKQFYLAFNWG